MAGGAILGVGVWVKVDSGSLMGVIGAIEDAPSELNQIFNVGYLLIAVGGVLLLMGFLGCCGAMRESRCMLLIFFVIVLLVFIAEVVGAIMILVFQPLAEELIKQLGEKAVEVIKKDYGQNTDITGLWDATMDGNITGCFPKLVDLIEDNTVIIAAVALGVAALEIAAMAVSMSLYRKIGSKRR
ncbi:hypothetical protein JZ751_005315 [Albula glossodonta]|uniref:Tetraspanin n=1 Tax=Albula glossodonta TaxID=121402 RepID=A0A8T2MN50_9TELE|nr:hypothetical protein JZ751_005315 [Albula glossodonta]